MTLRIETFCNKIVFFFSPNEDSPQALDLVPAETWVKIFEYLNQDELLKSISLVYKNWFQIVSNERKSLTIQGKNNSKKNSKNIADVQSLVSRFPNLKELTLKHKIFWITKESPILPLNFRYVQYLHDYRGTSIMRGAKYVNVKGY